MYGTTFAAMLAAVAIADEPHLIQKKLANFSEVAQNDIVISQIDDLGYFTFLDRSSYADPDPIQTANTETFHVEGVWNDAISATLTDVIFTCDLLGSEVFRQTTACTGEATPGGQCEIPSGVPGQSWTGDFYFAVPAIAPPF